MKIELSDLDLDEIATWPWRVKTIFIILACCMLCFIAYFLFLQRQLEALSAEKDQTHYLAQDLIRKTNLVASLEQRQAELYALKKTHSAFLKKVPEQAQFPALIEDFSTLGLVSNLELRAMRLSSEKALESYKELPFQLVLEGSYAQLADFLHKITGLVRLFTVEDFTLEALDPEVENGVLSLELKLKAYHSGTASTSSNSLVLEENLKTGIEALPLDSLKLVGTIARGTARFALLADKRAMIYTLGVGDLLGKNNGKIIEIADDFIVIQEQEREITMAINGLVE